MRWSMTLAVLAGLLFAALAVAQTQNVLTNESIVAMTKEGFEPGLIIKDIQASKTNFDVSPQALIDLKNAGVSQTVMEAMLTAQGSKPSAVVEAAHGADSSRPGCDVNAGCLLRDGMEVQLRFAADLNSKTAHEGDPVEFLLDNDLKVGDTVVIPKGAHAVAIVSTAKKAGMMGKPGDLSVQLQYLIAGSNHIHLRGTKGKEGDSKTGATVALTVIFGPIGLIKHGKNVDLPAGTPLTAYIEQDVWLPPVKVEAVATTVPVQK